MATEGEELGYGEYLFAGAAVEGKLSPALAPEDGTSGSPVLLEAEEYEDLPALALQDRLLLGRAMHA